MQLVSATLVAVSSDRDELTPSRLRDLLLAARDGEERVEHIKVIESGALLWVGAYVSVIERDAAQHNFDGLCARVRPQLRGWLFIELSGEDEL